MHSKRILTITAKNNIAVYHQQSVTRSIMRYQIQLEKICKIKQKLYMLYEFGELDSYYNNEYNKAMVYCSRFVIAF